MMKEIVSSEVADTQNLFDILEELTALCDKHGIVIEAEHDCDMVMHGVGYAEVYIDQLGNGPARC